MFYTIACPIPANTTYPNAVIVAQMVDRGVIHHVEVQFPSGCAGLAHIKIIVGERQAFPTDPDTDFIGDGQNIVWDDEHSIESLHAQIRVVGWNDDDTYPHTPIVRVGIHMQAVGLGDKLRAALLGT